MLQGKLHSRSDHHCRFTQSSRFGQPDYEQLKKMFGRLSFWGPLCSKLAALLEEVCEWKCFELGNIERAISLSGLSQPSISPCSRLARTEFGRVAARAPVRCSRLHRFWTILRWLYPPFRPPCCSGGLFSFCSGWGVWA